MKTMDIIRQRCFTVFTGASYAVVAAVAVTFAVALTAFAADEVAWIDLTGIERVPSSESCGVLTGNTFDNIWISRKESNTISRFSSKQPVGFSVTFR